MTTLYPSLQIQITKDLNCKACSQAERNAKSKAKRRWYIREDVSPRDARPLEAPDKLHRAGLKGRRWQGQDGPGKRILDHNRAKPNQEISMRTATLWRACFSINLGKIRALRDLEFLVSGNAIDHPPPNWVLLPISYIYNAGKPLNTLINRSITWFRQNLMVLWGSSKI